jgi:hypothetical protein
MFAPDFFKHILSHTKRTQMKKLFLSMSMAAVSLLALANAPKNNSEKSAKKFFTYTASQTLQGMYGKVEKLQWSKAKDDLLRADFSIDGENFTTFFDLEGQFVATTSVKSIDQLPAVVRKSLKQKFEGKEISSLVQYESASETAYFAEIRENNKTRIFRVGTNGAINRFQ